MTWGQFIRWADPKVEVGPLSRSRRVAPPWAEWPQWTASPPNVVDLDKDGKNEVIGVPNVEKNEPYETQAYAILALEGSYGDGSRSAMRKAGWEIWPAAARRSKSTATIRLVVPAAATVKSPGDDKPEIVVSLNDGLMYAFDATGKQIWKFNYSLGKPIMYSSEPSPTEPGRLARGAVLHLR
ncbi:MAG: hypothetical protein U0263_07605 [Polyangiaceae bacterium]